MCDFFWQRMDTNDQGGDLADIVRSVNGGLSTSSSDPTAAESAAWQFPADAAQLSTDDFDTGDAFSLRDPLLNELTGTGFFDRGSGSANNNDDGGGNDGSNNTTSDGLLAHQKLLIGDEMKRPCDLFSRVLQISPAKQSPSPRAIKPLPMIAGHSGEMVKLEHGVQISSPRPPGIKRRKSQAKKVVCIPAPAAASSKSSGEVVPSDLWAWRKYGQKPIKGSPYPRGYYRCSSSKGCSARKQVERSRTDPNMLVITYTSEHNHPWPTQRNALAGSTRSQPSKNAASSASKRPATTNLKEEPKEITTTSSSSLPIVKEEAIGELMENVNDHDFNQVFYNEAVMAESSQPDDFFADLAELEPDPMSLIFSRPGFDAEEEKESNNNGLDQFINMFDWGGSSFGDQSKKGL